MCLQQVPKVWGKGWDSLWLSWWKRESPIKSLTMKDSPWGKGLWMLGTYTGENSLLPVVKSPLSHISPLPLNFGDIHKKVFLTLKLSLSHLNELLHMIIYILYIYIYIFSQIIPPSPFPTVSKRLFCTSVSLLLSRISGYCYHLSKSHIYVLIYCIGVFLSGLLHSA